MDILLSAYRNRLEQAGTDFVRYLMDGILWEDRLSAIVGARGVGKTTLMLQRIKKSLDPAKAFYLSLDDLFFSANTLTDVVFRLRQDGVSHLFLDEVHKYPRDTWAQEIKNLYDAYPDMRIVFSGSSILNIHKGNADLSRRAVQYELSGLSFREFLALERHADFPAVTLEELLATHRELSARVTKGIKILPVFRRYLRTGYYPYYREGERTYIHKLRNTVTAILETDLPAVDRIEFASTQKLKRLLSVIAERVPFTPNMAQLGQLVDIPRTNVAQTLSRLERARLLGLLRSGAKNLGAMAKPDKVYLDNTNLACALCAEVPDTGNLRETFFYNQVRVSNRVTSAARGDFTVNGKYVFEVGGRGKDFGQVAGLADAWLAVDDIETGMGKRIPLWLFGFLY